MWQGYFVEAVVLAVLIMGFVIRGFKVATDHFEYPLWATPVSHAVGALLPAWPAGVSIAALIKIIVSMTWVIVIALQRDDGRRLAPLPGVLQHLLQARPPAAPAPGSARCDR